jgi:hypothetical protein
MVKCIRRTVVRVGRFRKAQIATMALSPGWRCGSIRRVPATSDHSRGQREFLEYHRDKVLRRRGEPITGGHPVVAAGFSKIGPAFVDRARPVYENGVLGPLK